MIPLRISPDMHERTIMAIKKYTNNQGTFYHASTYLGKDELGKEIRPHKRGFKTKKAAQDWIDNVRVYGLEEKAIIETYQEVYDEWLETYKLTVKPSTYNKTVTIFNHHILPKFGKIKIQNITKQMVQKAVNAWAVNFVRSDGIYSYFKKILTYAVQEGYINSNPCDRVVKVRSQITSEQKINYLEAHELKARMQGCKDDKREWIYPLFRLLAYTGMRRQEVLPLKWSDIDLEQATLSINKALTVDYDNKIIIGETKNQASHAVIALDQETLTALKRWQYVQATKYRLSTLVFPARNSNQYHSLSYPNKQLKSLCQRAKIPIISVHGLRHTHCTLLIRAGINIKDVQARMRHSDIETTLKIYTHQTKDTQKVVNTFSEFVANS